MSRHQDGTAEFYPWLVEHVETLDVGRQSHITTLAIFRKCILSQIVALLGRGLTPSEAARAHVHLTRNAPD